MQAAEEDVQGLEEELGKSRKNSARPGLHSQTPKLPATPSMPSAVISTASQRESKLRLPKIPSNVGRPSCSRAAPWLQTLGGTAEAAMWSSAAANLRAVLEQMSAAVSRNQAQAAAASAATAPPPPAPPPVPPAVLPNSTGAVAPPNGVTAAPATPTAAANGAAAAAATGGGLLPNAAAPVAPAASDSSASSPSSTPPPPAATGGGEANAGSAVAQPTAPSPPTPNAHATAGSAADIEAAFSQLHTKDRESLLATLRGHVRRAASTRTDKTDKTRERSPRSLRRELDDTSGEEHVAT